MSPRGRLLGTVVFAAVFGYVEAAVAVYLRRLWELGAVDVANLSFADSIVRTEVVREVAALGIITAAAWVAGRRGVERLAHAAVIFGTWDILYYAYLRVLTGWPASLLDYDILFLIPRAWVAPVLAPVLVSIALVAGGAWVVLREEHEPVEPRAPHWGLAALGGAVVVLSFLTGEAPATATGTSTGFIWPLFAAGLAVALVGLLGALRRSPSGA